MEPRSRVPAIRVTAADGGSVNPDGAYVLYWMIANRRTGWNWALERAVEWARHLGKPLVVLEALRCDYRWASDRLHAFVLKGMADNAAALASRSVTYVPYVEPAPGAGKGLLETLAARACVVITDDAPVFFLPRMAAAAAKHISVRFERIDANGLLPLRATDAVFPTAHFFRRLLQRLLPVHLEAAPLADPLAGPPLARPAALPEPVTLSWPAAGPDLLAARPSALAALPVDHHVPVVQGSPGGAVAGGRALERFLAERLSRYADGRNHPDEEASSGLSPYLHFGHVSPHQVLQALAAGEGWTTDRLSGRTDGKKSGWWGMSEHAEAFLDELVTWRELGLNFSSRRDDGERYESLPPWARATLEAHAADRRDRLYSVDQLAGGATHDPLWNAAQRQLLREGTIHNYLRMLWGKNILAWTRSPHEAIEVMFELNNRFALDGRDPNSASGIMWCLGRYDRPWGPERPVFGTVRYMSSANTMRKLRLSRYLERFRE